MNNDRRIETAARAMAPQFDILDRRDKKYWLDKAARAVAAITPKPHEGWLAPWEATPQMLAAFDAACDENRQVMVRYGWRTMRDAHIGATRSSVENQAGAVESQDRKSA